MHFYCKINRICDIYYFSVVSQLVLNSYCYKNKLYLQSLNGFKNDWQQETSFDGVNVRHNRQIAPFLDGNSQHKVSQLNHQGLQFHRDLQQNQNHAQNRFTRSNFLGSDDGFNWNNLQRNNFNTRNEESAYPFAPAEPNDRLIFEDNYDDFQNAQNTWSSTTTARTAVSNFQFNVPDAKTTLSCERSCQATSEYNPVCGSDGMTYHNKARFFCARRCGKSKLQNIKR